MTKMTKTTQMTKMTKRTQMTKITQKTQMPLMTNRLWPKKGFCFMYFFYAENLGKPSLAAVILGFK